MANPFVSGQANEAGQGELELFREYAWDFDKDCFIFANGRHKIVTENEALKVWIYKTLKTERWRYRAYDSSYGVELEQFVGTRPNDLPTAEEVDRYIREALLVNPYITSIEEVKYTTAKDLLELNILLTTVYGQLALNYNLL